MRMFSDLISRWMIPFRWSYYDWHIRYCYSIYDLFEDQHSLFLENSAFVLDFLQQSTSKTILKEHDL